ncbi:MAG: hypothetical protein MJK15_01755 [Colwellia sp.]|nr:hypothetical protein [Colwellia sp.]
MNKLSTVLPIALLLGACTSSNFTPPGQATASKYAPVQASAAQQLGRVTYMTSGADFVVEARREDAYKKMYKACNERYVIVKEGTSSSAGQIYQTTSSGLTFGGGFDYRTIYFDCVED